jgi:tetratricopeptide (TPR) repeat protein
LGGSSGRHSGWLRAAVVVALGGALYASALGNDLVWDDRLTAAAGPDVATLLTRRTGGYYRPLVMLSFALERGMWGVSPLAFHAGNVVCHLAVAWLLGALVQSLGLGAGTALASALLFTAHPVQTEAVTYVSGRTDVLAALFVLLALLAWRRAERPADRFALAGTAAFAAALLAKEIAVLMPLALLLPAAHPAKRPPRPILPLALAAAWLVAWAATGGPGLHAAGLVARLPAVAIVALTYARLLVVPVPLHLERFTAVQGWPIPVAIAAWSLVTALGFGLVWLARRLPSGLFLLALAALAYLPGSGLIPVYPAIADRALFTPEHFLYLPLLGLAPLAAAAAARVAAAWPRARRPEPRVGGGPAAISRAATRRPLRQRAAPRGESVSRGPTSHPGRAVLAAILAIWSVIVVRRNRDWRDEDTLFRHTLAYDPPAARVWFNLGNLSLAAGRLDEARRLYEAALAREPHDAGAHLNLGITLQRQGERAAAEAEYRRAIASDPRLAEAYRALATLLAARGETAEAARLRERLPPPGPHP